MRFNVLILCFLLFLVPILISSIGLSKSQLYHNPRLLEEGSIAFSGNLHTISGDLIISNETLIEDKELVVSGNIIIESGGALILKNSTIYVNATTFFQYGIEVHDGGNITVLSSVIRPYNESYAYYFRIYGKVVINNSEIFFAGQRTFDDEGIFVSTNHPVLVQNSYIHNSYFGISISNSPTVEIVNSRITPEMYGIQLNSVSNVTIVNNTISNCYWYAIDGSSLYNASILKNIFRNSYMGIKLTYSYNVLISNNTFTSCKGEGLHLGYNDINVTVSDNIFTNIGDYGIFLENNARNYILKNIFSNINYTALSVRSVADTLIRDNVFYSGIGIFLSSSTRLTVSNNSFINSGVHFYGVVPQHFNHTFKNNMVNNLPLMYIFNKSNIVVSNTSVGQLIICYSRNINIENLIIKNTTIGTYIALSSNITISSGHYSFNRIAGILMERSYNASICFNSIELNTNGIYVSFSENITLTQNILYKNDIGVVLQLSKKVLVFNNNFLFNQRQAVDDGSNAFDNGTIGNFWSDYHGIDSNNDGIGDTPYSIDYDSVDRFPLMQSTVILEKDPPTIESVYQIPQLLVEEDTTVIIQANVSDNSGISVVILSYFNGTSWTNVSMQYNEDTGFYEAEIPPFPAGTTITYKIIAKDIFGNFAVSQIYSYTVSGKPTQGLFPSFGSTTFFMTAVAIATIASIVSIVIVLKRKGFAHKKLVTSFYVL